MCRMVKSSLDLHPGNGWDGNLCFDISIDLLIDGFKNRNNSLPLFNSAPFINKRYEIDSSGGAFFVPGKSSHSTNRVPGTTNVTFRSSAGEQASKFFLLFKVLSRCECGKGLIFVEFQKFYNDAIDILESLQLFRSNPLSLFHFERAAKALQKYCRTAPSNIVQKDKLDSCGLFLYNNIYNSSKIEKCNKCESCTVTDDVMNFIEHFLQFILTLKTNSSIKLTRMTDLKTLNHFVENCCLEKGENLVLKSNENLTFKKSNLF